MEQINSVTVKHYPFSSEERIYKVRDALCNEMRSLVGKTDLSEAQKQEWMHNFSLHLLKTEELYLIEEQLRQKGEQRANLTYHGRRHGIYQAGFDAICLAEAILDRKDSLSRHLSMEGVFAIVDSQIKHDSGYVEDPESPNFAARLPIHVERSIVIANSTLDKIGVPSYLNLQKVKELEDIGIHATSFPFNSDRKEELSRMLSNLQHSTIQEAHIVRLSSSLADLGGQVARVDYPDLLISLKDEFNSEEPGKGDNIIGLDHEMVVKCKGFIENVVIKGSVGKIANAFFGPNNAYQEAWVKHINSLAA